MHEVELANRVLNALREISAEKKSRILEVTLKVGEMNEPNSLKFWLKKLSGEFRSTKFKIQSLPLTVKCNNCGHTSRAKTIDAHLLDPLLAISCPKCGMRDMSITSGQELEIVSVKIGKRR
jgi:Zn finger protein HypA/HybF involved in hydrogenase expression